MSIVHGNSLRGKVTPEYRAWQMMKRRCYNPVRRDFKHYGGRGIKVCPRWINSFQAFLADMGHRPSPAHSIDRINNNGNYTPSNCRWATWNQQANNKRARLLVCIGREKRTVHEWARISGTNFQTIHWRLKRDSSPKNAIFSAAGKWRPIP